MAKTRVTRDATEGKLRGKDVLAYLNFGEGATFDVPVWALIGGQTSGNLSLTADTVDATTKDDDGWGETYEGVKSSELTIEGVIMKSDEVYHALKDAFINGEQVDVCRFGKDGNADRNWYSITECSDETPHDDMATYTLTLNGVGKPTFYTGLKSVDEVKTTTVAES